MHSFKKTGEGILIAGISFLLFILFFEHRIQVPPWVQVVGRMHPLFLHFPIVLLLLYFFSLWAPKPENSTWADGIRLLAAISAVVTAVMGLLLALETEREGSTFLWHKWGGVGIALIAATLYFLHPYVVRSAWVAKPLTIAVSMLVLATGHWGAGLTHGENFLLEPVAATQNEQVPMDRALAFQHVILPLFKEKCTTCHGAASIKGGLALHDTASVIEGGKGGDLFKRGHPETSLIIKRILLPLSDKKHMAPKTKPQLTEAEVTLLQAWIKSGAPMQQKIIDLPVQDSFRILAAAHLSPAAPGGEVAYNFPPADDATIKALNNNYRVVTPLGKNAPALSVQFYGKTGYSAKALEELLQVKEQIWELSLARLPVKDEHLKPLLQFKNLRKLNLNYTDVSERGLQQLLALKNLEELAIAGVKLTPAGAASLAQLPQLKRIFIWNAGLDSTAVVRLEQQKKGLIIEAGYNDYGQTLLPLNPPIAKTVPGIYEAATPIELRHPFRGVEVRYTLDGSEPDSVFSPVYKNPFKLDGFTVVKAKAFKPGWYGSKTMKAVYFTKGLKPDSVSVVAKQMVQQGQGKALFDTEIGDLNLGSGNWLEVKKPTTYQLYFDNVVTVRQVLLNTFVRTEWDIFPAAKVEVWGGMDKKGLKRMGTWQQAPPSEQHDPDLQQVSLQFAASPVKYMHVVVHPLSSIPAWRPSKGKPSKVFLSEMVLQ